MDKLPEITERKAALQAKHKLVELCESVSRDGGRMVVRGPSQRIGVMNSNGRVYPKSVWEKNLAEDSEFMCRLNNRQALGELEHPDGGNTRLHAVSHLHNKVWVEALSDGNEYDVEAGDYVMLENLILDTPNGNILKELFEVDVPVGISSRGRGNTVQEGDASVVQDDYELNVFDYVDNPSVTGARHKVLGEAAPPPPGDLGSPPPVVPPDPGGLPLDGALDKKIPPPPASVKKSPPDVVSRADTLVAKMKEAVVAGKKDVASIAELFSQSLHLLDDIGAADDPEFSKIRGEVIALSDVLAMLLGGKKGKEKKEKSPFPPKKSDEGEEIEVEEASDPRAMVGARAHLADGRTGTVTSYQSGDGDVAYWVKPDDGGPAESHRSSSVRIANKLGREQMAQAGKIEQRSISMDKNGKGNITESAGKLIETLAEKNVAQKKQLAEMEDSIPAVKYNNLKTLCEKTIKKVQQTESDYADLKKRYDAAKQIIGGLVERVKKADVSNAVEAQVCEHKSLEPLREILLECKTSADVSSKSESLLKAIGSADGRSRVEPPLVTEGKKVEETKAPKIETLIDGLVERGM